MALVEQKIRRFLGEDYVLTFDIDAHVDVADVSNVRFAIADKGPFSAGIGSQIVDDKIQVSVPITPATVSGLAPGTYPFELSMTVDGEKLVVSYGTMQLDLSLSIQEA